MTRRKLPRSLQDDRSFLTSGDGIENAASFLIHEALETLFDLDDACRKGNPNIGPITDGGYAKLRTDRLSSAGHPYNQYREMIVTLAVTAAREIARHEGLGYRKEVN